MGNNIKKIRKQKGMTQGDLSEMVGVTRQYISDVENLKKYHQSRLRLIFQKHLDPIYTNYFII